MKQIARKSIAILLSLMMLFTSVPSTTLAAIVSETSNTVNFGSMVKSIEPDDGTNVYVTFEFYVDGELVDQQIVNQTAEESVIAPATPETESGKRFLGWYVGDQPMTFGEVSGYNTNTDVKVDAHFSDVYYVYFMTVEDEGSRSVYATREATEANGYAVVPPTDYEPKGARVVGWTYENGSNYNANDKINEDTYLLPVTVPCHWVTFYTQGGTGVPSVYYQTGEDAINLADIQKPTKLGYVFVGWSEKSDGTEADCIDSIAPTEDKALYAIWKGDDVTYTIVYWGENADNEDYSVLAIQNEVEAKSDEIIEFTKERPATLPATVADRDHFTFEESDSVKIAPDNSSVVNVYFKRKTYTITFTNLGTYNTTGDPELTCTREEHDHDASGCTWRLMSGWSCKKTEHTHDEDCYSVESVDLSFTFKYDQDIAHVWNKNEVISAMLEDGYVFRSSITSKYYSFLQKMPNKDITMTATLWSGSTYTWYYYLECLPGKDYTGVTTKTDAGKTYWLYHTVSIKGNSISLTYDEDYFPITGYKQRDDDVPEFLNRTADLYYTRNSYELTLKNYGAESKESLPYESSLEGKFATPSRPEIFSKDAEFKGWYAVEPAQIKDGVNPVDLSLYQTMPAKNLVFHAYWKEPSISINVVVDLRISVDDEQTDNNYFGGSESIPAGTSLADSEIYGQAEKFLEDNGQIVLYWTADGERIDVNQPLYNNTEIKPVLAGKSYTVTYKDSKSDQSIIVDDEYMTGAFARVDECAFTAPDGYVFSHYVDEDGKTYYPGSYVTVNGKNVTLTAQYVPVQSKVAITYHSNFDTDVAKTTDSLLNNGSATLATYESLGLPTRTGYTFAGWSTGETVFDAGAAVRVNNEGSNDLYAVWNVNKYNITYKITAPEKYTTDTYPSVNGVAFGTDLSDIDIPTANVYPGYTFSGWSALPATMPDNNVEVTGSYTANENTPYKVEYYYQNDDGQNYPSAASVTINRAGKTDETASATDADKADKEGGKYKFDASNSNNKLSGTIAGDGSLVLKLYFKLNESAYTIHHYLTGTTTKVADDETKAAIIGTTQSASASTNLYSQYSSVVQSGFAPENNSITIDVDSAKNVIIVYYAKRAIEITASSGDKVYDGQPLTNDSYTNSTLAAGDQIQSVTVAGSQTNAGSSANVASDVQIVNAAGENVTDSYSVTYNPGTLTVSKREVTLTSATDTKVYDGTPLKAERVTPTAYDAESNKGFVPGEGVIYTVTGSRTEVGTSDNTFTYEPITGTTLSNYVITPVYGKLTVTEYADEIVVTTKGGTFVYDGQAHGATVSVSTLPDGYTLAAAASSATATDVTTKAVPATADTLSIVNAKGEDVTSKLTIKYVDGSIAITKRKVTLTSATASKTYDGTALTNGTVTVGDDGFVTGEGVTYDVTGTITNVGSTANAFTYALNEGTKADNYNITKVEGTLTINPVETEVVVTIKGNTATEEYNGETQSVTGYEIVSISNDLYIKENIQFTGTAAASRKDVGTTNMGISAANFADTSANFTNVRFVVTDGSITITAAPVTVTADDKTKVYGTTDPELTATVTGLKGTDAEELITYDIAREEGEDVGDYVITPSGAEVQGNYNVTYKTGTFTITPVTDEVVVTIVGNKDEKVFNGAEQSVKGYAITNISNTLYAASNVGFNGNDVAARKDIGTTDMGLTSANFNNTSANFENVRFEVSDGSMTITPATVTVTADNKSKIYGAQDPELTATVTGLFGDDTVSYDLSREPGEAVGTYTITPTGAEKQGNYVVEYKTGTLTITKESAAKVIITGKTNSVVYNGNEQTFEGYDVSNPDASITVTLIAGSDITARGTEVGHYMMGLNASMFTATSPNFESIEIEVVDGWLDITPVTDTVTVTITGKTDSQVYDGTEKTVTGYTFSADNELYLESYVNFTGKAEAKRTDVGVTKMNLTAAQFTNISENFSNVTFVVNDGWMEITPVTDEVVVTIVGNNDTQMYNGQIQSVEGYEITEISNTLYSSGDVLFTGTAKAERKDAGTTQMGLAESMFANGNANFSKVTFVVDDGYMTITKRNVTLTSATDDKTYDGTALKNGEITVSGDGFVSGEGATCNVTGSQTEVGSSPNSFTYTLMEGTKADNYNITTVPGTLTVTALTDEVIVTITENSGEFKYDGSEKTVTGYTVTSISNDLYKVSDFSFSGDATVKGVDAGTYAMNLKPEDFTNNSKNITNVKFVIVNGTLEITKRAVTLTSATREKVYDSMPLTDSTVTVTGDGWASGEGAAFSVTGSQTEKGESPNAFTYTLNANTKAENYDITKVEGTLKVTDLTDKVTVTITENSRTEKYDGTEKTVEGYTVSISNSLYTVNDFVFKGNDTVTGTDAGTYDMLLKPADFENKSANFTNVEFVIKDGTLVIEKRVVTLTSATKEKVYDGTPLTDNNVAVGGEGFAEGEGATYNVTGTITDVGSTDNSFTYTLNEGTKADNYTITTEAGTLTVTPVTEKVTVTITENSGTEKYDGNEKTVTGYKVTSISNPLYFEKDFTFSGDATVKGTDAGNYGMELKPADFTNVSENFSDVEFVIVDGKLEIAKRNVTLTSATDSREYNGNALANSNVTVTGDGFVENEGATYNVTGSQTLVGSSDNEFTYTLDEGTKAANYEINTVFGTLTVTDRTNKYEIEVVANSGKYLYDGTVKTAEGFETLTFEVEGNTYTVEGLSASVTETNAGEYVNEITGTAVVKDAGLNDVTAQFTVTETDGKLVINKRKVTMTSADAEKTYDGDPLTKNEVNESGDGFVDGEGAAYNVTGSQTAVGESKNTFTYTLNEGTKADNYIITTEEGTLKVTEFNGKVVVTITENKGTYKYDGTEKKVENYTVSINTTLYTEADFVFTGSAVVTGTDAGTYNMELKPENFDNISKNFKDEDVTFEIVDGTLVIEKRVVTLTSADGEKVYDGTALTNDNVTVGGEGFADKEGATYDVTGTITNVGSTENTFTYTLNEGTKADNYTITTEAGTLKVTPVTEKVTVTITENSGTEKYDGTEKTVTGYEVTSISNPLYTEKDFTFSGDAEVKGTDAGTYDMQLKPADFENKSANFTNVEFVIVDGTLVIEKRVVTLTSADDEQVYNGKALTNDTVTVTGDGFADGEGATCDVTGTITNVGSTKNTFTYTLNDGTKAGNYTITTKEGTLTVTPVTDKVTVTITENSGTEKYDGSEKTVTDYKVTSISNSLYTEKDFEFKGNATVKGTDAGTYDMLLKPADFKNISENFTDVVFEIVDGKLEITKRNVTLTSATDDKMYDGKALTNSTVSVTGDGFVGSEGATYDVTGTQTEVGESKNAFTYELKEGTLAGNYDIDVVFGTLTVTELTDEVVVTITEHSGSYTYDGTEKTVTGYDVKIDNPLYFETDFTFTGDATIKGTEAGSYPMELIPANFTNKSDNFSKVTFNIVDGTLEIARKAITVTADSDNKIYDGTALTDEGYTSTAIAKGDKFASVTVEGSQLNVGSSKNIASAAKIVDENGKDVTASYDISYIEGTLTVNQKAITITADNGTKEYDGTALVVNSYKGSDLAEGDAYVSVTVTGSQTKVGSSENIPSAAKIINAANEDVTANYDISYVNGTLTVTQTTKELKVVANSHEWFYDGTAHADGGYTVYYGGKSYAVEAGKSVKIETGDTVTATITKTVTNVDDTAEGNNEIVELVVENADQYAKITEVAGTLTIKPIDVVVTIKGNNDTAVYDGKVHTITGYTATANTGLYDVEKDFTFSGDATASRTEVGTTNMGLKPDQFKNINTNFANVTFQVSDGYQSITPIDVVVITIVGNNNTTDYDGEEHSVSGYEVTINNPLYKEADFVFKAEAEAVRTDAGTTMMGLNADQFENINKNFKQVTFNVTDGYQTINPINVTVTITEHGDNVDYDGKEHTVEGYDVEIANPLYTKEDFTFSGTGSVSGTNAGTYDMELTEDDFENINANFEKVTFEIVDGQLVIDPIDVTVTITEHSGEVDYDGKEHTVTGYDVEIKNTLYTEEDFTFSGNDSVSGTNAGTYDMELTGDDFANTNDNFANVTFVIVDGQLVINKINATVTIVGASNTTVYDGTEHKVEGYNATASTALYDVTKDFTFSGTAEAARKNVGTVDMGLAADQFANINPNFDTVTFVVTDGSQTITEKPLTITAESAEKEYDGTALTKNAYTATALAEGDSFKSVTITGSITNVGTEPNVPSAAVIMDGEEDVTANYAITYVNGELKITQTTKELKVVANSETWTYDSENHSNGGYTVTYGDETYTVKAGESAKLSTGDTVKATITKTVKNVADTAEGNNAIVELVVTNEDQYKTITKVAGTLTITQRPVTITAASDSKEYDGTALTNAEYEAEGLAEGDATKTVKVEGSIIEVGTEANVASEAVIVDGEEDVTANYAITYVNGELKITQSTKELKVVANSNSWMYDSEDHADGGYTVTYGDETYTVAAGDSATLSTGDTVKATITKTVKNVADTAEGNNAIVELVVTNEDQYKTITKVAGTLTITQRPVTITAASDSKEYDGTALTNAEYEAEGLAEGDATKTVKVEGSIIEVGTVANVASEAVIVDGEEDVTANYAITYVEGELKITQSTKELKVVANSNSWMYDSKDHADGGYTVTYGDETYTVAAGESATLSTGDTVKAKITKTVKNVADTAEGNNAIVELVVTNEDQYKTITEVAGTLTITQRPLTITADSNEKLYDGTALTDDGFTADGLATGDEATSAKVEGSQTLVGSSYNVASDAVVMDGAEDVTANYDIEYVKGTLTVTEPSDHSLVIVKTHAGREYKVGETVEFVITVKNIFADARTITITEIEGVTITGESVFEAVAPDAVVKTTAEYVITDEDVIKGGFTNTAYATFTGSDKVYEADDKVETVDATSELIITKTVVSTPANGETYALGETVKYEIVVENTANLTIDNIVVVDPLTETTVNVGTLAMSTKSDVIKAEYVVTSDDILNGKVINVATATGTASDGTELTDTDKAEVETDDVNSKLTVVKTSDVAEGETVSLGDVITYTIKVTNDGNVPFYNVWVVDEWTGDEWMINKLEIGETRSITATYTVTSDDILAGKVVNEVTAEGDPIDDPKNPDTPKIPEDDDDEEDETDDLNFKLTATKVSDVAEGETVSLGETINYTITVTNAGNVPFYNVEVVDEWTDEAWTIEVLAVGETKTFTTDYTVVSDDILKGYVTNAVVAEADLILDPKTETKETPKAEAEVTDETDDVDAKMTVVKNSDVEDGEKVALGETITYTITVTNEGNVPYYNVKVVDEWTDDEWTIEVLGVGETEAFTAKHVVTSDDILEGKVVNSVTAEADDIDDPKNPDDPKKPEDDDKEEDETDDVNSKLTVVKTSDVEDGETVSLGETITYTITVTNDGNVPFYNVKVVDEWTEDEWTIEVLAVGETKTFTTTHVVTSDDILAGKVVNEVTAEADEIIDPKNPDEPKKPEDDDKEEDETDDVNSKLTVVKTSDVEDGETVSLGETITYTITVTNDGNVPFYNVKVVDEWTEDEWTIEVLAVGETKTFTAEHVVDSDDILNGKVVNSVTAEADEIIDPKNPDEPKKPEDDDKIEDETDDVGSGLVVTKNSKAPGGDTAGLGETIEYTITVENVGNVPFYNVVVTDEWTGDEWTIELLAVGEKVTFETSYIVTSDDILAGKVVNEVTATADPIDDPKNPETPKTPEDDDKVEDETDDVNSKLTVVKTSDVAEGETVSLGDVITYTIKVTNDGNVPFYNVVVTDEWTDDEWTIEVLAVGETATFTATYTVTSDDILAGKVVNEVTAEGDPIDDPKNPDTPKIPEDDDDEEDETDDVDAELVVTKTSDVAEGEKVSLGDVITYTIVVKNAGNVPFYGVEVIEQLEGAVFVPGAAYAIDGDGNAVITKLAVGAAVTLTAKYTVTSDDILNGFILNEVTAEGDPIDDPKNPDTPKIPEDDDDEEDETDDVNGKLSVTKTSEVPGGDTAGLGETINYTIVVKNEGNVPYYNVVVTDEWTGDEWTIEVLAVGESVTFETSYTVTSDDVLAGKVVNEVTAKADPIDDPKNPEKPVTPEDDDKIEDETDDVNAKISVVKTSDVEEGEKVALGETITYTIVVKNEGNVPYYNVVVTDEWTDDVWTIEVLAVGESKTFTTTYVVTSDDILAGKVVNEVTVEADDIDDPKNPDEPKKPEDDDDEEDETDDVDYELEVIKTSDVKEGETVGLGETIAYTIQVTNKGNVPYYNVKVVDEWTNDEWTIDELAVGETKTFTTSYVVKESDLIKGTVLNEVTVKADPIDDPKNPDEPKTPEDEDDIEDPTDATKPSLFIEKKTVSTPANGESYALGETISYEITVLNNGNLTITDIVVTDELTGDTWTIAKLEVGEMSAVLKTSYVVTEADILAGSVLNVATATGKTEDPKNPKPTVTPGDIEDPTDEPDPDFDLEKTLINLPEKGYFTVGEKAVYEIVVKNVGNLTLTDIVVTEDLMDAVFVSANDARATVNGATATISELKPGEAVTLTAEYVVKIEDLSTDLRNFISGSGNGPVDPEEDDDNEVTPVDDLVVVAGSKIWDDVDNAYGTRPESITVRLYADNVEIRQAVVTEADGWKFSFDMLPKHNTDGTEILYSVTEDAVIGYNTEYALDSYDITNSLTEHVLTIRYWYYEIGGEVAAETHESIRKYGEPYDVESPYVIGHSPDAVNIAGIITEDVSYDVIYTRNKYKIVIEYMYLDGTYVWPRITETLYYEDAYEFWTPELEGYTPNYKLIKGNMPHYDLYFKVIYVPDETDIIIEEYGVPLGVGTVEMNVGECFE